MVSDRVSKHSIDAVLRAHLVPLLSVSVVFPTVGIALSEALLLGGHANAAMWTHFVTLLICTIGPMWFRDQAHVFLAFALVPVLRLVSLGMPVFFEPTIYWLMLVYLPFLPAVYVVAHAATPGSLSWGLKWGLGAGPTGVVVGAVLAVVGAEILRPQSLIGESGVIDLLLLILVLGVAAATVEEMLFRGVLQRTLSNSVGDWQGVILASGLFGLMHAGFGSVAFVGFAVGLGILLGVIYHVSDSLLLVVVTHGTLKVALFGLIPLFGWALPVDVVPWTVILTG